MLPTRAFFVLSCPSAKSCSVTQTPSPPILISPHPAGLQLRTSQEIFRGAEGFRMPAPLLTPHMPFCVSEHLQHPWSWLGPALQTILFFNILYLTTCKEH